MKSREYQSNYLELAKLRWRDARIRGYGRWAISTPFDGTVTLYESRAAVIAASLDGRRILHGADLGPMKAFVKYQLNVRKRFKPNPGKNPEAIVACKITDYLAEHQGDGDGWISQRDMFRGTHVVIDWGPSIVNRALNSLEVCGDIEQSKLGRQKKVIRRVRR
jgi:hypothetical protein